MPKQVNFKYLPKHVNFKYLSKQGNFKYLPKQGNCKYLPKQQNFTYSMLYKQKRLKNVFEDVLFWKTKTLNKTFCLQTKQWKHLLQNIMHNNKKSGLLLLSACGLRVDHLSRSLEKMSIICSWSGPESGSHSVDHLKLACRSYRIVFSRWLPEC